ncbi:MAG: hypothetical protein SVO01_12190, partial [Thermotogota bacterium]|nr:hypothetical protein [Thermotogota bacterium]
GTLGPEYKTRLLEAHRSYKEWAYNFEITNILTKKDFKERIKNLGIVIRPSNNNYPYLLGVKLNECVC